eukprot:maker-scaffold125_size330479-snap-gene-2.17 protein:Tk06898 transcript:maker-scaffold125_size330479-snap-gene-2.17-mRNA-1 annotation:"ski oncogene"
MSRDHSHAEVEEAILNGENIPAFNVGGELRMCLPQIIRQTLSQFQVQQICRACEELQIHCADCTNSQLSALKANGYLAISTSRCGLITKSDAERLTSYLHLQQSRAVNDSGPSKAASDSEAGGNCDGLLGGQTASHDSCDSSETKEELSDTKSHSEPVFIQHECFGTAKGILYPELYANPGAKCIRCSDCHELLDPQDFIRHLHSSSRENRTCHWGFDPVHWRSYLHLQDDAYASKKDLEEAAESLEIFKRRFRHPKLTRKQ